MTCFLFNSVANSTVMLYSTEKAMFHLSQDRTCRQVLRQAEAWRVPIGIFKRWTPVSRGVKLLAREQTPRRKLSIKLQNKLSALENEEPPTRPSEESDGKNSDIKLSSPACEVSASTRCITADHEHDLLRIQGKINSHHVTMLIDSSSTHDFEEIYQEAWYFDYEEQQCFECDAS